MNKFYDLLEGLSPVKLNKNSNNKNNKTFKVTVFVKDLLLLQMISDNLLTI